MTIYGNSVCVYIRESQRETEKERETPKEMQENAKI